MLSCLLEHFQKTLYALPSMGSRLIARNQGNEGLTTILPSKTDLSEPETLKSSGVEEESVAQSTTRDPRKKFDLPARVEGGLAGELLGEVL